MGFLILAVMMMAGKDSPTAVSELDKQIAELSVSDQILHRRLLRILQNSKYSVANLDNTSSQKLI